MPRTLLDYEEALKTFLDEADVCANTPSKAGPPAVLGFAAMSLALACVVSVGDALWRKDNGSDRRPDDRQSIEKFCEGLPTDWLMTPVSNTSAGEKASSILWTVRNAMLHAVSLPDNVKLYPARESNVDTTYGIAVDLFVAAVRRKVAELVARNPTLGFDLDMMSSNRSPAMLELSASRGGTPRHTGGSMPSHMLNSHDVGYADRPSQSRSSRKRK